MFRQRSGSSLCFACGKLNRVDAAVCFYCGARQPGLWGFAPLLGRVIGRLDVARAIIAVCVVAYVASLLLNPAAALRPRGVFDLLAPGSGALYALGAAGAIPWAQGRWWTVLTGVYLHGSLLHILFNMIWVRQLAPPVEELFGRARLVVIFTAAGVAGFVVSNLAGVPFTIGASGAIFGLLGAMVYYGRSRGGVFGLAVLRQYGQWALVIFAMGFFLAGVNNLAHAGGFAGGYLAALWVGYGDRRPETGVHRLAALALIALTVLGFALALWTTFAP
jgi:membrane associated rhomboid family serine protease